jgi:hypothetical protein
MPVGKTGLRRTIVVSWLLIVSLVIVAVLLTLTGCQVPLRT